MALFSNTLAVIRQYLSSAVGDLIIGTPDSGTSTTIVDTMLRREDDYYNKLGYECYIYAGTNIGEAREVVDWQKGINTLTLDPAFTAAIVTTSLYELHRIFTELDYRKAINLSIESIAGKYLVDIKDESTIQLTSTTDNLGNTVYTYEYALPLSLMYLHRVITEDATAGVKLTGTISDASFTNGETITGLTSGATGELAYDAATYIRVRKVSGTFVTGETATGGTSGQTCSAITAVASETAGMGRWLNEDELRPHEWDIITSYPPKLKLNQSYPTIDEGLLLRLEGQGVQPIVTADTDVIYLPPAWVVQKAITFLPQNKIQSNNLEETYKAAVLISAREPLSLPHPRARRIVE